MTITFAKKKRKPRNQPVDVFKRIDMHGGDKTVCWEWKGVLRKGNRGEERPVLSIAGREQYAYRVVWSLYNGRDLEPNEVVRHRCDNSRCCNPFHLIVGTQKDNIMDQARRERIGHKHADVKKVMQLLEIGMNSEQISKWMEERRGVYLDGSTVRRIKRREFYRHIAWPWGDEYALRKGYLTIADFRDGILLEQYDGDGRVRQQEDDADDTT